MNFRDVFALSLCTTGNRGTTTYNSRVIGCRGLWLSWRSFSVLDRCEVALQDDLCGLLSETRRGLKKVGWMIGHLSHKTGLRASQCVVVHFIDVCSTLQAIASITFAYRLSRAQWWRNGSSCGCSVIGSDCTPHARCYMTSACHTPTAPTWRVAPVLLSVCSLRVSSNKKNILQKSVGCLSGCFLSVRFGCRATKKMYFKKRWGCWSLSLRRQTPDAAVCANAAATETDSCRLAARGCDVLPVTMNTNATNQQALFFCFSLRGKRPQHSRKTLVKTSLLPLCLDKRFSRVYPSCPPERSKKLSLSHTIQKVCGTLEWRSASKPRHSKYISACSVWLFFWEIALVSVGSVYWFGL